MIGVAQVIGTNPTFNFFFSSGPMDSFIAAFTLSIGNIVPSAAAKVPPPTSLIKRRRAASFWSKTLRTIAFSITRSSMSSELSKDGLNSLEADVADAGDIAIVSICFSIDAWR